MIVRIKFDADIIIEGKDMSDVKDNWFSLPIFTEEAIKHGAEFGEVILVEDAETYEDLGHEFNNA